MTISSSNDKGNSGSGNIFSWDNPRNRKAIDRLSNKEPERRAFVKIVERIPVSTKSVELLNLEYGESLDSLKSKEKELQSYLKGLKDFTSCTDFYDHKRADRELILKEIAMIEFRIHKVVNLIVLYENNQIDPREIHSIMKVEERTDSGDALF